MCQTDSLLEKEEMIRQIEWFAARRTDIAGIQQLCERIADDSRSLELLCSAATPADDVPPPEHLLHEAAMALACDQAVRAKRVVVEVRDELSRRRFNAVRRLLGRGPRR